MKIEMGRGNGRGGGWYKYMEVLANPEYAQELRREEHQAARERAKWERAQEAERAERERERAEQRRERREDADHGQQQKQDSARPPPPPPRSDAGGGGTGGTGWRRWRREDLASMRARTWDEYDAAFEEWRERATREGTFRVAAVPLPPAGPVGPAATEASWHAAVKKATLRWHPDKWARFEQMLADEADREALKQLTQAQFRSVARTKERGWRNARATAAAA